MKINKMVKGTLYIVFSLIVQGAFIFGIVTGCSFGAKNEAPQEATETIAEESKVEEVKYEPIQEKILASIQKNYSGTEIEITGVELSTGGSNMARIELQFPGRSLSQKVVTGMHILSDNFPRLKNYSVMEAGVEYSADKEKLDYIFNQGYDFACSEEVADQSLDVILNGVPTAEEKASISTE